MSTATRMPRILCFGQGYACQFAGWVLARSGADVELVLEQGTPPQWTSRLAGVDICITDDLHALNDVLGGTDPWPDELRALTLVEIGWPGSLDDANARIAALSGIGAVIGETDGPGLAPPGRMLEALVGLQAATGGLAGWLGAQRDGLGEHVHVDPIACMAVLSGVNAIQFLDYGLRWRRSGRSASGSGGPFPFRMFRCLDGWVVAICRSRGDWKSLLAMLGDPDWSRRPEYADPLAIARHHADEVAGFITDDLCRRPVADVVDVARRHRVPLAPVRTTAQALADHRLFVAPGRPDPIAPVTITYPSGGPTSTLWQPRSREPPPPGARAPLDGLRVLDLGWVWAAPVGTAWLADLGADVVRVESLDRLDLSRRRGLEFPAERKATRPALPGHERAWLFNAANRNKRSLRLELKEAADRDCFLDLVACADVVVESFSAGVLERLGIAPDVLLEVNPHLLVLSMGGEAIDAEYISRSYAPMLSALAGVESQVVDTAGEPLGLLNWGVADPNAGCWGSFSVVAALARREAGSHIVLSQLRALGNTCVDSYRGNTSGVVALEEPEEVTQDHLVGMATGTLGDVYRTVVVRDWTPEAGERRSMGAPWRFRRMPVGVRAGAPLLGTTTAAELRDAWSVRE